MNKWSLSSFREDNYKKADVMDGFLMYLKTIKNNSSNTLISYKNDLQIFFKFINIKRGLVKDGIEFEKIEIDNVNEEFIKEITEEDLYDFIQFCKIYLNNGATTTTRKIATLKVFFKYLKTKLKIIEINPATDIERPRTPTRITKYLSLDESIKLLTSYKKGDRNLVRDKFILTMFLNCGMRLSELCSMNLKDIKGDTVRIIGKGDKERFVSLNDICLEELNNYIPYRNKLIQNSKNDEEEALLISERGNRLSRRSVQAIVEKYLKIAGLREGFSTHKLRHTAATLMYQNGDVDIRTLQVILGHESVATTQIYTHTNDEVVRSAVNRNPLNKKFRE